ncbi:hypothetical protein RYX36_012623 [Vicia faba]
MKHEYAINPGIEHYSCMVDLFARAGCFGETMYLIEEMPFQADANMWLSVLRGCISYGNKTIGKMAAEKIIQLDPENSCAYIQLSNILATFEDWEGSTKALETCGFPIPNALEHNRHCVIMSLVQGYPLFQVKQLQNPDTVFETIIRLAENGIIHCDFNEFNIMLEQLIISLLQILKAIECLSY